MAPPLAVPPPAGHGGAADNPMGAVGVAGEHAIRTVGVTSAAVRAVGIDTPLDPKRAVLLPGKRPER